MTNCRGRVDLYLVGPFCEVVYGDKSTRYACAKVKIHGFGILIKVSWKYERLMRQWEKVKV